jgi:hypothetical protein
MQDVGSPKDHDRVRESAHTAKWKFEAVWAPAIWLRPNGRHFVNALNGQHVVHVFTELHKSRRGIGGLVPHLRRGSKRSGDGVLA